ncbi:MAG: CoA-binding protein [Phycisphaerae bacterium]
MQNQTVAIVGASSDRTKFGNKSVRAHLAQGWTVYPVNPRGGEIEGLPVYRSVDDLPQPIDRVSLYLPPDLGVQCLPAIARLAPSEFFVNPGAESDELMRESERLGLTPLLACSIVDVGRRPSDFA